MTPPLDPLADLLPQLAVLPIVLPLLMGALLLWLAPRAADLAAGLGLASLVAVLVLAAMLALRADTDHVLAYALGDWPAPFGITLVVDRLAALMLLVSCIVAIACQLAARGEASARFPALLQLQVAGLHGAFLTGDLFNLFVCFEMLLAASYALLLDAQGDSRLRAGLHYVAINLVGSSLFLVAAALLYGVAGSLNLADLALRLPLLAPADQWLAQVAGLLLLVVFAIKAAALPLGLWLPGTYGVAPAHVAALFAIMTKVGIYAIIRVHGTLFAADLLAAPWLLATGLATLVVAALGALAAGDLRTLVAWLVMGSAGTLLVGTGLGTPTGIAAALYYLPHSTFAAAALFLVVEMIARARTQAPPALRHRIDAPVRLHRRRAAGLAALFFVAALFSAGLPPGAGFVGKALLLEAAQSQAATGLVWGGVLLASLVTLVALLRTASDVFWKPAALPEADEAAAPAPPRDALLPATLWLLAAGAALALLARPVHAFLLQAAGAMGAT